MCLSKAVLSYGDYDLCMGRSSVTLNTINVSTPFTDDSVLVIDNLELDNGSLRREWSKIPEWYKLSASGPWASSENACLIEN